MGNCGYPNTLFAKTGRITSKAPFVENLSINGLLAKIMQDKSLTQKKAQPTDFSSEGCAFFIVLYVFYTDFFQFRFHNFKQNIVNAVRIFTRRNKFIFLCDKTFDYQISFFGGDVNIILFQAKTTSALTISVARLRILFIFCTHSIGAAAFNFSVMPSFSASDFIINETFSKYECVDFWA